MSNLRRTPGVAVLASLAFVLAACREGTTDARPRRQGREPERVARPTERKLAAAPAPLDPAAVKEADARFATFCSTCHGPTGKGDGPAGKALKPPARNFSDPEFQRSRSDAHLAKVILEGGAAVGLSPVMPPNPQYKSRPDVLKALVAKVRSFGPKP